MVSVLIVLKDLRAGNGMASAIFSYYDGLIGQGYDVDFLLFQKKESDFLTRAKNNGHVYYLPNSRNRFSKERIEFLLELFRQKKYEIIHVNLPGSNGAFILKLAKKANIKNRIFHAHNPINSFSLKSYLSGILFGGLCKRRANFYIACSKNAGESVFHKKEYTILKNTIYVPKYKFSDEDRNQLRSQLGISDNTLVVGTVGRIEEQKNPLFAIDCFNEVHKINNNSVYIWVGEGSLRKKLIKKARKLGLSERIILPGNRPDVNKWYSAMDCFLLPSRFEGLGIVFIEAQTSGLMCFGSTAVPDDTEITSLMNRVSISLGSAAWGGRIARAQRVNDRNSYMRLVSDAGYDSRIEKDELANIYQKILNTRPN